MISMLLAAPSSQPRFLKPHSTRTRSKQEARPLTRQQALLLPLPPSDFLLSVATLRPLFTHHYPWLVPSFRLPQPNSSSSLSLKPQFLSDQPRFDPILLQSLTSTTLVRVYSEVVVLPPQPGQGVVTQPHTTRVRPSLHRSGLLKRGNISPTPAATIHRIVHHWPAQPLSTAYN